MAKRIVPSARSPELSADHPDGAAKSTLDIRLPFKWLSVSQRFERLSRPNLSRSDVLATSAMTDLSYEHGLAWKTLAQFLQTFEHHRKPFLNALTQLHGLPRIHRVQTDFRHDDPTFYRHPECNHDLYISVFDPSLTDPEEWPRCPSSVHPL